MTPTPLKSLLLSSVLLLSMTAQAQTISEKKRWKLSEVRGDGGIYCVASTKNDVLFRAETFHVELTKLKNQPTKPLEVFLKIEKNKRNNKAGLAQLPDGSQLAFVPYGTDSSWALPRGLSSLIQKLRSSDDEVEMKVVGGSKSYDFKIKGDGFSEIIREMESRCNSGLSLVNAEFESLFASGISPQVNPLGVSGSETARLRQLYFSAFNDFGLMKENEKALARVLAKYQTFVDELRSTQLTIDNLKNIQIPQTQAAVDAAVRQQREASSEISRLDVLIPKLVNQVKASQEAYDRARSVLAPHEPEFNRITSDLRRTRESLSSAEQRLSYVERKIQEVASNLNSLRSEASNLEHSIPMKRRDLQHARDILRDAERDRAAFNYNWEKQRRLERHREYHELRRELVRLEASSRSLAQELRQIQGERARIQQMLNQCRANNKPDEPKPVPKPIPRPKPAPRPGTTDVAVSGEASNAEGEIRPINNCAELEQALAQADRQVAEKQRQIRELESHQNQVTRRLERIDRDVDADVRRDYDRLVYRENEARRHKESIEDSVRRDEDRLSVIRVSEIPRLERMDYDLRQERPQLQSAIAQLSSEVNRLSRDLAEFKARTEWDRKAGDVSRTGQKLQNDQADLSAARSARQANAASLEDGRNAEARGRAHLADLNSRVAALSQRVVELNKILETLPSERAPFDQKIAELSQKINEQKDEFLNIVR